VKRLIYITILVVCFGLNFEINGQQFGFDWAKKIGLNSEIAVSTHDDFGNIYIAGTFQGTYDFDPGSGVQNLSAYGINSFIVKMNSEGHVLWAKSFESDHSNSPSDIAVDSAGNVYTTGTFNGIADFDPGFTTNTFDTGVSWVYNYGLDVYISKLDENGDFVWARQIGNEEKTSSYALELDDSANVYTTGTFKGIVDLDPGVDTNGVYGKIFLSKLNSDGNYVWGKALGSNYNDRATELKLDKQNNIIISGRFLNSSDMDPSTNIQNISSAGTFDIFVSKYNSSGDYLWARSIGGIGKDIGRAMAVDDSSNILIAGSFHESVDFDPDTSSNIITSNGEMDAYICKLDSGGLFKWVQHFGDVGDDLVQELVLDNDNNIYSIGHFTGNVDLDPGNGSYFMDSNPVYSGQFIQKLNSAGEFNWAKSYTPGDIYELNSIGVKEDGRIYLSGLFEYTTDLDIGDGVFNLESSPFMSAFVSQYNQCSSFSIIDTNTCSSFTSPSNNYEWQNSGSFLDTIPNTAGCDSVLFINLITELDISITSLGNETLKSNTDSANYQWLNCSNSYMPISGETNQLFTASSNGSFAVEITKNGCIDTSICYDINNVGLYDIVQMDDIVIFPNPVTDIVNIQLQERHHIVKIRIINVMGESLQHIEVQGNSLISMKLEGEPGIYYIELMNNSSKPTVLKCVKI